VSASERVTADEGEEGQHGLTPRAARVADALSRLAATARSFLLYDARNDAIRDFLAALMDGFQGVLEEVGELALEVRPLEIVHEGQVVYLNRDHEKSMAFKLYRDGVRGLRFRRGLSWEELTQLLEVLSVRYTGIHQNEDDVVTLLWKAGFQHLDVVAVEGFTTQDDEPRGPSEAFHGEDPGFPDALALSPPSLPVARSVRWVDVADEALERLQAEAGARSLAGDCLALLGRLSAHLHEPHTRLPFAEVAHVFAEVRDFLLSGESLPELVRFLHLLEALATRPAPWDPTRAQAAREMIQSCGEVRAIARLLRFLSDDDRRLQSELAEVVERACASPLDVVLGVLALERGPSARAAARQLLEIHGRERPHELRARFAEASGPMAADLLRVIADVAGESAAPLLAAQCANASPEVQEEAVWHLERLPYSGAVGRALSSAYPLADRSLRPRLLAVMEKSRDRRLADSLARHIETHPPDLEPEEAGALGRVVGRLGGASMVERCVAWLAPPSRVLRRLSHPPLALVVAATAALSEMPGEEAERALSDAMAAAPEARTWVQRSLDRERAGAES
jgi:hypothetical protein